MRVRVLGRLTVCADPDGELDLGTPKQRAALALLLVRAGQLVTVEQLIDELWPDNPPKSALANARTYTANLRRLFRSAGVSDIRLESRGVGYVLNVEPEQVDLTVFQDLLRQGRDEVGRGDLTVAVECIDRALGLWRGQPFEDFPVGPIVAARRALLVEEQVAAIEDRAEFLLGQGQERAAVYALREHVQNHPTRERGWELLMTALHRAGDVAGALTAYTNARAALVEHLGLEPGARLRELHQTVLQREPSPHPNPAPPTRVPAQLPMDVRGFAGRAHELAQLDSVRATAGGDTAAVVISAIAGTAGVGKTALAVRWAHRVAPQFPDGQLYIDLRGYDPDQPVAPADALTAFLLALGVKDADIPYELGDRAARYRTALAGRRLLILLDNASAVDQVRPLLPGSPSCLVVVTSRDSLAALVSRHGAQRVDLDLLPLDDAVGLLRVLIGGRVDAEPEAAVKLARQCARLPLALRVSAELVAAHPERSMSQLTSELADLQSRLDLLDAAGDPRTAIRAVFSWSYRSLPPAAARAFRLLGLHPGVDFDVYAVAAITESTTVQARQLIDLLTRAHLVQITAPDRCGMHDLLHAYAVDLVAKYDGAPGRQAALRRLFDHYLVTAAVAIDGLYPSERHRRPDVPSESAFVAPVAGADAAQGWLDTERANLVAVCVYGSRYEWSDHAIRLAAVLFRYLDVGSHYADALTVHAHARDAARRIDDRAAEGHAMTNLGTVHFRQGRNDEAIHCYERAITLFRETDDRFGQARALTNLGFIYAHLGRHADATDNHQEALTLFREVDDHTGESIVLKNLGLVFAQQARYEVAAEYHQQAIDLSRRVGHSHSEAHALAGLGVVRLRQGAISEAASLLQQALILCRETAYHTAEAIALTSLGTIYLKGGRYSDAVDLHRQALGLYRQSGHRDGEAEVCNNLGETHFAFGEAGLAATDHAVALAAAIETDNRFEQGRAYAGLALAFRDSNNTELAGQYCDRALALCDALGAAEVTEIHRLLATPEAAQVRGGQTHRP